MMPVLELQSVCAQRSQESRAPIPLRHVNLTVEHGEFVGIWGQRRSGRTTLLRIAAGFELPESGVVLHDGRDAALGRGILRRRPPTRVAFWDVRWDEEQALTVLDHVALALLARGMRRAVEQRLRRLVRDRVDVTVPAADVNAMRRAVAPNDQATGFFAGLAGVIGFLIAFNAMLLTAPERRRMIASLRVQGYAPRQLIAVIAFQALVLGTIATAVGLAAGDLLARSVFDARPDYLAGAFAVGRGAAVRAPAVLVCVCGGLLITLAASATPLVDLRRRRAVDAIFTHPRASATSGVRPRTARHMVVVALALAGGASALLIVVPSAALLAGALLGVATLLALPAILAALVVAAERIGERSPRANVLVVAAFALRATGLRAVALGATGAIAIFGAIAVDGGRANLLSGLSRSYWQYTDTADLWVVHPSDDLATRPFAVNGMTRRIAAIPWVADVRVDRGGFADLAGRRIWLAARPPTGRRLVPTGEVIDGVQDLADDRLRRGGWVTLSRALADAFEVGVGDRVSLPTPTGHAPFRVAAVTTNLGWASGAVVLNGDDYRRRWGDAATALEIDLAPGASISATRGAVVAALGRRSALQVQTTRERADQANALAGRGLRRLTQISTLLIGAAALAMAAAMSTSIWQRRASLSALRIQSFSPRQLRQVLLVEALIVLAASVVTGTLAGIYGQLLVDRYLGLSVGFPIEPQLIAWRLTTTILLIVTAALVAVAILGVLATRSARVLGVPQGR